MINKKHTCPACKESFKLKINCYTRYIYCPLCANMFEIEDEEEEEEKYYGYIDDYAKMIKEQHNKNIDDMDYYELAEWIDNLPEDYPIIIIKY